jgi:hypothetical protein
VDPVFHARPGAGAAAATHVLRAGRTGAARRALGDLRRARAHVPGELPLPVAEDTLDHWTTQGHARGWEAFSETRPGLLPVPVSDMLYRLSGPESSFFLRPKPILLPSRPAAHLTYQHWPCLSCVILLPSQAGSTTLLTLCAVSLGARADPTAVPGRQHNLTYPLCCVSWCQSRSYCRPRPAAQPYLPFALCLLVPEPILLPSQAGSTTLLTLCAVSLGSRAASCTSTLTLPPRRRRRRKRCRPRGSWSSRCCSQWGPACERLRTLFKPLLNFRGLFQSVLDFKFPVEIPKSQVGVLGGCCYGASVALGRRQANEQCVALPPSSPPRSSTPLAAHDTPESEWGCVVAPGAVPCLGTPSRACGHAR